jgi:hypothetical protein
MINFFKIFKKILIEVLMEMPLLSIIIRIISTQARILNLYKTKSCVILHHILIFKKL